MSFLGRVPGSLTVELTSADPEEALGKLVSSDVSISGIRKKSDLTFRCRISRADYTQLASVCEKQGYSLKILTRNGPYWALRRMLLRPLLMAGLLVLFLSTMYLPTRVLFIRVQGNSAVPANQILSAAQECGITFFASRKSVRSEKVKNELLFRMPELEWVGVNTAGCVATISVRERMPENDTEFKRTVSSIVADRDGFLLSVTVTSGNPLCAPGQYVTQGQLLVSGYTDCGLFIRATPSEAEILAQTARHLDVVRPTKMLARENASGTKRKYSLLIGKKRINLWKGSGIWDTTCGRIYEEKYAALPGGFQLPLALCIEEYTFYETQPTSAESGVKESLSSFAQEYLRRQMTAGTVLSKEEMFSATDEAIRLVGEYTCQEMIGKVKQEQMGDEHGKNH